MVWMSEEPLASGRSYLLKVGTCTVKATVEPDLQIIDLDSRESRPARQIGHNEIGTGVLQLDRLVCVDRYADNRETGSFILLDPESYDTIAIGTIEAAQGRGGSDRDVRSAAASGRVGATRLFTRASESRLRSAAKALTWRLIASVTAFTLALMLTGNVGIAGSVALVDIVSRTILYYLHERLWSRVAWGTR
jgi:uncharacterized membrane protein